METEKLGIDNLKVAIVAAITLAEKIENKLEDGKITIIEALNIGTSSFGSIIKVIKSGTKIRDEFLDLDSNEKEELIALIELELDFDNDNLEVIVENAIAFLLSLEGLIRSINDLRTKEEE